jgi:hypothetical protein
VTLILVVDAGVVNVPGEVKTVMFVKPPAAAAADVHVEPLDVRIFPDEPGATKVTAEVPLPKMTLLAVRVVAPVPPEATGNVPVVRAEIDVAYTAPPDVKEVTPVPPTFVATVPVVIADPLMPVAVAVVTTVPLVAGNVNTVVPATAGACKVTAPLVSPDMTTLLIIYFLD